MELLAFTALVIVPLDAVTSVVSVNVAISPFSNVPIFQISSEYAPLLPLAETKSILQANFH